MNAKVKLAMEIAEKISDKKVKIEQLVKELNELESQASLILSGKSSIPSAKIPYVSKSGRYSVKRKFQVPKISGGYWRPRVLEALSDGKQKTLHEIHDEISSKHTECPKPDPIKGYANGVSAELTYLIKDNLVERVGRGLYRLKASAKSKNGVLQLPKATSSLKLVGPRGGEILKFKGRTPNGYWKEKILSSMVVGNVYTTTQVMQNVGTDTKDQRLRAIIANALDRLFRDGVIHRKSPGEWVKKISKNEGVKNPPVEKKEKKAIKNFEVKTLTPQQEKFLKLTKPDSLASKVLQTMKHGKEYSVEELIGKIGSNKPKLAYYTVMKVLTSLDFTKQVKASVYVRI